MSETKWLTVKEAAESLGLPIGTVYHLASNGVIAHYRFGVGRGRLKFKPEDVEAFLESKRVGPAVKKKLEVVPRRQFPVPKEDHLAKPRERDPRRS